MKHKTILLCGGTGLIGNRLKSFLNNAGYRVTILSRQSNLENVPDHFFWDPTRDFINPDAILNANVIINLAGTSIADRRWNAKRKQDIMQSRARSNELIYKKLTELKVKPDVFISASAIGYYGNRGDELVTEDSPPGTGFLAETAQPWELSARKIESLGVRTTILRIGIVFSMLGGALPKMIQPIQMMLGAPLGSGDQYMSWIHIDDVCSLFIKALTDRKWSGVYNAVSPHPVTNKELTEVLARLLDKPLFLPGIPEFAIRTLMGEMATLILDGTRVSSHKAEKSGFKFQFPDLEGALRDLLDAGEQSNSESAQQPVADR